MLPVSGFSGPAAVNAEHPAELSVPHPVPLILAMQPACFASRRMGIAGSTLKVLACFWSLTPAALPMWSKNCSAAKDSSSPLIDTSFLQNRQQPKKPCSRRPSDDMSNSTKSA